MVVPYIEKKEVIQSNKTTDSKISDIVNNKNLSSQDKAKLINQLLAKTQIRLPSSDETSIDMFNETSDQTFNDSNENDNLFPLEEPNNNDASSEQVQEPKIEAKVEEKTDTKTKKVKLNETLINEALNQLNNTTDNAQFFLPASVGTRKQTKKIKNPLNISTNKVNKQLKEFAKNQALMDNYKISKHSNSRILKNKRKKSTPYHIPPRLRINESQMEFDQTQTGGNFWSIY